MIARLCTITQDLRLGRPGRVVPIFFCLVLASSFRAEGQEAAGQGGLDQPVQRQGPRRAGRPRSRAMRRATITANTFRVEDGVLKVSYDQYPRFDGKFGHLFSKQQVRELPAADRVPLRGRPVPRRAGLGLAQQRRDDPQPVGREHAEGPGIPRLDRGPVPRRRRARRSDRPGTSARRAPTS